MPWDFLASLRSGSEAAEALHTSSLCLLEDQSLFAITIEDVASLGVDSIFARLPRLSHQRPDSNKRIVVSCDSDILHNDILGAHISGLGPQVLRGLCFLCWRVQFRLIVAWYFAGSEHLWFQKRCGSAKGPKSLNPGHACLWPALLQLRRCRRWT